MLRGNNKVVIKKIKDDCNRITSQVQFSSKILEKDGRTETMTQHSKMLLEENKAS